MGKLRNYVFGEETILNNFDNTLQFTIHAIYMTTLHLPMYRLWFFLLIHSHKLFGASEAPREA